MKNSVLRHISAFVMLIMTAGAASAASDVQLTVTLDSAHLLMGKTTPLHINLTAPADDNASLVIPKDSLHEKVEILDLLKSDTIDHGNGRIEINRDILLQSFDSGDYRLKPILYVAGGETIQSNRLVLRVLPVMKDSIEFNDFADISDVERKWTDYLPDFLYYNYLAILIGLALIIFLVASVLYYLSHRAVPEEQDGEEKKPLLSPYDQAMLDLGLLREQKLCEKGQEKQYYSLLTEILRVYLYRRFGINAMEMTSTQILNSLQSNPATRIPRRYMNQVLEIADFVKFAKVRPLPDDNVQAFDSAVRFIEDTKPVPVPEENAEGENSNVNTDKN